MAKTTWALDPTHSEVSFKVKHMMFTNVSGNFKTFNATVETEELDFSTASISFEAEIASINTNNTDRDNHLKSADFFDAEKFPKLTFVATKIVANGENNFAIHGNLTLKEVTKEVALDVNYSGMMKDPWGNAKVGFSIEGKINRKDFGLNWNAALETGGVLVGEEVKLAAEVQFVKQ
jgi:polyisoprenoid-binding protein YceI